MRLIFMVFNIEYARTELRFPADFTRSDPSSPLPYSPFQAKVAALWESCTASFKECKTAITSVSNFNEVPPRFWQKLIKTK